MHEKLKARNTEIKNLKIILRNSQTSKHHSVIQLDNIMSSSADRKAFIYLLDMFDTEKEITKELLEDLIDNTFVFNELLIEHLSDQNSAKTHNTFNNLLGVFDIKNIKNLIIMAIFIGVIISVSMSETLTVRLLSMIGVELEPKSAIEQVSKNGGE